MAARARAKYLRVPPRKARLVADLIRGKNAGEATSLLGFTPRRGARALEHLRMIAVELQMVPVRGAVHIGGADFFKVSPIGQDAPISAIEDNIVPSLDAMLDDMVWWARATMEARRGLAGSR